MKALRVVGLVIAAALWLAVGALGSGCSTVESIEPSGDTSICERSSPSGICAVVYGFARPADNELGHVELCVMDEDLELAESMFGSARWSWSPRLTKYTHGFYAPACFWMCGAQYAGVSGCNAYGGAVPDVGSCLCPELLP